MSFSNPGLFVICLSICLRLRLHLALFKTSDDRRISVVHGPMPMPFALPKPQPTSSFCPRPYCNFCYLGRVTRVLGCLRKKVSFSPGTHTHIHTHTHTYTHIHTHMNTHIRTYARRKWAAHSERNMPQSRNFRKQNQTRRTRIPRSQPSARMYVCRVKIGLYIEFSSISSSKPSRSSQLD